jgi:hypothetical protein
MIYISGPISGMPDYNRAAFAAIEGWLKHQLGYECFNPLSQLGAGEKNTWVGYMRADITALMQCDRIIMLKGWEKSRGACLELYIARQLGIEVINDNTSGSIMSTAALKPGSVMHWLAGSTESMEAREITVNDSKETILEEADRLVSVDRQKQYGHPREDFTRIGKIWGAILQTEPVAPEKVALCMVGVKISREVNAHKRDNLVDGAGYFKCADLILSYNNNE